MSQYRIISIVTKTINIINCTQESGFSITKQGAAKKKMHILSNIQATQAKCIISILKTIFERMHTQMT